MNPFCLFVILLLVGPLFMSLADGQTSVSSNPMGYVTLNLHSHTDNRLTVPLLQEATGIGHILEFTSNTLSLDNSSWTPNQFAPANGTSYYAEISTGPLAGLSYPITGNTVDTLTLATGTDDLTNMTLGQLSVTSTADGTTGDLVRIRPYWTVSTVFGSGTSVSLTPFATQPAANQVDSGDSLLFFNGSVGIDPYPTQRLFYVQSTGWRTAGDATTDQSGTTIPPLSSLVVRSQDTNAASLILLGDAYQAPATIWIPGGQNNLANDSFVGLASSEPVTLDQSGLASSIMPTAQINQRQDLVLLSDPIREGFERSAEQQLFYLSGTGWVLTGSTQSAGSTSLDPTQALVIRQRATSPGMYWRQNAP